MTIFFCSDLCCYLLCTSSQLSGLKHTGNSLFKEGKINENEIIGFEWTFGLQQVSIPGTYKLVKLDDNYKNYLLGMEIPEFAANILVERL